MNSLDYINYVIERSRKEEISRLTELIRRSKIELQTLENEHYELIDEYINVKKKLNPYISPNSDYNNKIYIELSKILSNIEQKAKQMSNVQFSININSMLLTQALKRN